MSDESRKPIDLFEMYRRYESDEGLPPERDGGRIVSYPSRAEQWEHATRDATIDELADAEEEARMLHLSTGMVLIDRLVELGHKRENLSLEPFAYTRRDWFFAPLYGKPAIHYGDESDSADDWRCHELDEPVKMSDAGGYTVARMRDGCYAIFTTSRRREPLPWAAEYAEEEPVKIRLRRFVHRVMRRVRQ